MQQRQDAAAILIGLGQHGLGCLGEDVALGIFHHFLGHVRIANSALGTGGILMAEIVIFCNLIMFLI